MNKVILMGRLTDNVKAEGKKVKFAKFTLAVRDGVDEEGNSKAQFIRCTIFNKGAELLEEYTAKGSPLCISGRLQVSSYEDDDEVTRWTTDVIVDDFDLIGAKKEEAEPKTKKAKSGKYHK